jgi:hypothetical protein
LKDEYTPYVEKSKWRAKVGLPIPITPALEILFAGSIAWDCVTRVVGPSVGSRQAVNTTAPCVVAASWPLPSTTSTPFLYATAAGSSAGLISRLKLRAQRMIPTWL